MNQRDDWTKLSSKDFHFFDPEYVTVTHSHKKWNLHSALWAEIKAQLEN